MSSHSGFTLVEIMVAIVVAGILMATGLPAFLNYSKALSEQQARDVLESSMRMARQQSVTAHVPVIIAFGNGSSTTDITTYTVHTDTNNDHVHQGGEPFKSYTLPKGTKLNNVTLTPTDTLVFDSSGSLAPSTLGGTIFVGGASGSKIDTLAISATGLVYRP
jgi:prepilin-type N-terminal cleavage/methylation domain-containing protein